MASNQVVFAALAITAAIFLPAIASATVHTVGDESGWTVNFDYAAWAKDKKFWVGDELVFNYPEGKHNVAKVNGTGFKDCVIQASNGVLTSGKDVIPLATPGRKWYICGVADHCAAKGQKLVITVLASNIAPSPTPNSPPNPATPSSAYATIASGCQAFLAAALVAVAMIAVV